MKNELPAGIPEDMKAFWDEASFTAWRSDIWWKTRFAGRLSDLKVREMSCFNRAWADWLATDNPHAIGDRLMMKTDRGRFMNLISITGKNIVPGQ